MISEQHRISVGRLEKGSGCRLIVLYFSQLGLDNNSTILALSLGGALSTIERRTILVCLIYFSHTLCLFFLFLLKAKQRLFKVMKL